MATITPALKSWAKDKSGKHLVMLRLEAGRKTRYISLGFKIRKSQWNPRQQNVRASHPNCDSLNEEIKQKVNEANDVLSQLRRTKEVFTVDDIKDAITTSPARSDFWKYSDNWLETLRQKEQVQYWRRCRAVLRKLMSCAGSPLPWSQFNERLLREFDMYMSKTLGNSSNTRRGAFRVLHTIVADAIRDSVIRLEDNPFPKFKRPKSVPTQQVFLTPHEIEDMTKLNLKRGSTESIARDMYAFAYWCRGARFGDVVRLKWQSVKNGRIEFVTGKTGDTVSAQLTAELEVILSKYDFDKDDEFIFPPLRGVTFRSAEEEVAFVSSVNARVNKALKRVAEMANIQVSFSFHTSRHSFSNALKNAGIDHSIIQSALKHKNSSTTDKYLKAWDDESHDEQIIDALRTDR